MLLLGGQRVGAACRPHRAAARPAVALQAPIASSRCSQAWWQGGARVQRRSVQVAARRRTATAAEEADDSLDDDVTGSSRMIPRDQKFTAPEVVERGAPEHPYVRGCHAHSTLAAIQMQHDYLRR